ncbi:hypothetical protein [Nonomuraea salmonea]|uniref:hypothetical protein n=1 Tax=Nonomuraea salmonea TaxID=46181 RepID=UPI0031E57848
MSSSACESRALTGPASTSGRPSFWQILAATCWPLSPQMRPITTRCSPRGTRTSRAASGVARWIAPREAARSAPGARASCDSDTPLTAISPGKAP